MRINWPIAKHAARNTLLALACIGFISLGAFFYYSSWIFKAPALAGIGAGWYLLYRIEIAWRKVRLRNGLY
jgi:hypothetical protein